MSENWKPGDLVSAYVPTRSKRHPLVYLGALGGRHPWRLLDDGDVEMAGIGPTNVQDVRPLIPALAARRLVVIDPENEDDVTRLADALVDHHSVAYGVESDWLSIQAALREYANPTPPRVWTDGDVVASSIRAYHRQGGAWWPTRPIASTPEGYRDADMEEMLESDSCSVLREQAAEATP